MEHKLVLPANQIANELIVSKLTGSKLYYLRRKIEIYRSTPGDLQTLHSDGDVFLVDSRGNISLTSGDTELVVRIDHPLLDDAVERIMCNEAE